MRHHTIHHSDHDSEYPIVDDLPTLVWMAQQAALELHVPQWRFGPRGAQQNPDRLVLDLDPGEGVGLPECVEVALAAREVRTCAQRQHSYLGCDRPAVRAKLPPGIDIEWLLPVGFGLHATAAGSTFRYALDTRGGIVRTGEPPGSLGCEPDGTWLP